MSTAVFRILMGMLETHARRLAPILLVLGLLAGAGCETSWSPAMSVRPHTRSISVDHHTDGTYRRMEVTDNAWYQLTGADLVVLDMSGRVISRLQLAPPGTSAPAKDLITVGDQLVILLGDTEVIVLDRTEPWRPVIVERIEAASIGLWPTAVGRRGDDVLVLGQGAARTLAGGIVARSDGTEITSVVEHGERLLHVAGRRIHRRAGDQYLGTASLLQAALPDPRLPEAALLFARNERSGALVGFLGADCRELDASKMTVAVRGNVSRMRQRGGRVLAVSDEGLAVLGLTDAGLQTEWFWHITGMEDADWISDHRLAVAGTFGAGIVTIGAADPVDTAVMWHAVPAGLTAAASDGEGLRAESPHGHWVYEIGQQASTASPPQSPLAKPAQSAAVLGWSVQIDDAGMAHLKMPAGDQTLTAPRGGRFSCIAATEDSFWLGHDHGIVILSLQPATSGRGAIESRRLSILIDGPVICIEPLVLGRGVAFASRHGGFGVVREEY